MRVMKRPALGRVIRLLCTLHVLHPAPYHAALQFVLLFMRSDTL